MSIRRAASCAQPRQESSGPRGARTGRGPDMRAGAYSRRPATSRSPSCRSPMAVIETRMSSPSATWYVCAPPLQARDEDRPPGDLALARGRDATGRLAGRLVVGRPPPAVARGVERTRPETDDARDREVVARRAPRPGRSRWPRRPRPGPAMPRCSPMSRRPPRPAGRRPSTGRRSSNDRSTATPPGRPRRSPTGSARVTTRRPTSPASAGRSASASRRSRRHAGLVASPSHAMNPSAATRSAIAAGRIPRPADRRRLRSAPAASPGTARPRSRGRTRRLPRRPASPHSSRRAARRPRGRTRRPRSLATRGRRRRPGRGGAPGPRRAPSAVVAMQVMTAGSGAAGSRGYRSRVCCARGYAVSGPNWQYATGTSSRSRTFA